MYIILLLAFIIGLLPLYFLAWIRRSDSEHGSSRATVMRDDLLDLPEKEAVERAVNYYSSFSENNFDSPADWEKYSVAFELFRKLQTKESLIEFFGCLLDIRGKK